MDGYEPKDIENGDLVIHYQIWKLFWWKTAKKCWQFSSIVFTGEMEKPLVIGKATKPQCFKNTNIEKLPIDWEANKNAWMT
jgi:hypothetical protein